MDLLWIRSAAKKLQTTYSNFIGSKNFETFKINCININNFANIWTDVAAAWETVCNFTVFVHSAL